MAAPVLAPSAASIGAVMRDQRHSTDTPHRSNGSSAEALADLRATRKLSTPDPIALVDQRRLTSVPNTNNFTLPHCELRHVMSAVGIAAGK